jgi:hypothetical protein
VKAAWRVKSTMVAGLRKGTYEDVAESTGTILVTHSPERGMSGASDIRSCARGPADFTAQLDKAVRRWLTLAAQPPPVPPQPPEAHLRDMSRCFDCGTGRFEVCAIIPGHEDWCTSDATLSLMGYVSGVPPQAPPKVALTEVQRAFSALVDFAYKGCFDERTLFTDTNLERYLAFKNELARALLRQLPPGAKYVSLSKIAGRMESSGERAQLASARKTALARVGLDERTMSLLSRDDRYFCPEREQQYLDWSCSPEGRKALGSKPCEPGPHTTYLAHDIAASKRESFADSYGPGAVAAMTRHEAGFLQMLRVWAICGCVETERGTICAP